MGSQLPALEQLFDEWSKKHQEKLSTAEPYCMPEQEEPYGGFVRDGIVNLESWKKQKVRICFILNEAGGRNGMEHYPNDFDLAAEWNERGSFSKFMFKLSVWTKAIQDAFGQPITYKKSDVAKVRDELIRSIAVINIKKSDGQRRTDFEILQRFANEDADELRRELELVNPNIIICGENLRFLREPLPIPPNKKAKLEREAEAAAAANSDTTVAPAENAETAETTETVEPAETVAATENATPEENAIVESSETVEGEKKNYVFKVPDLKQISKFTYLWGNKLVFSMWTPANFMGTISSNTINYYAVREVVRAALKAFGDYQKRQKIKQFNEQRHQEKLQKKQEAQQKKAVQAAAAQTESQPAPATTPAPEPVSTPEPAATAKTAKTTKKAATPAAEPVSTPEPAATAKTAKTTKKAATPAAEPVATPEPAAVAKTTKTTKKAATPAAESAETPAPAETKPKTRRTKKVVEDSATTEETPKKTTRRTKKVTTEE